MKEDIKTYEKSSFSVIGKEGSTRDGEGFIQKLWQEANAGFAEIEHLVKRDENGNSAGFWGAMSDFTRGFQTWENDFTQGLYLAGAEVTDDAMPPAGWVKWTVPAYAYYMVKVEGEPGAVFAETLAYLAENGHALAGAVHDFINPAENGQAYMFFPIQKL